MRRPSAGGALAAAVVLALAACARTGFPEGGPEDRTAPAVVVTIPEDRATDVETDVQVEIEYDEPLAPGIETQARRLVIFNPDRPEVVTNLGGSKIEIQPREPLLPQTTYSVTVLPGIQDRRSNRTAEPLRLLFSTGGPLTLTLVKGVVRSGGRPLGGATVRAVHVERELGYRALTDSVGTFELPSVAVGTYRVTAWNETNGEEGFQFTLEPGDTASADLARPGTGVDLEFDLVLADTSAPRATRAEPLARDGLRVAFSDSLDLATPPSASSADLLALPPDVVPRGTPIDSVAQSAVRGDSVAVAAVVTDPADARALVLRLAAELADSTAYAVRVRGLRNAAGLTTGEGPEWLLFRTRDVPDSALAPPPVPAPPPGTPPDAAAPGVEPAPGAPPPDEGVAAPSPAPPPPDDTAVGGPAAPPETEDAAPGTPDDARVPPEAAEEELPADTAATAGPEAGPP